MGDVQLQAHLCLTGEGCFSVLLILPFRHNSQALHGEVEALIICHLIKNAEMPWVCAVAEVACNGTGRPAVLLLKLQDARALVRTPWALLRQSEHSAWFPGEDQLQALLNTKE